MLFVFSPKDIACCLKQIKRFCVKTNATNCALYIFSFSAGGGGVSDWKWIKIRFEIEKWNGMKKPHFWRLVTSEGLKWVNLGEMFK